MDLSIVSKAKILSYNRITIPSEVAEHVVYEKGKSRTVYWHLTASNDIAFLSRSYEEVELPRLRDHRLDTMQYKSKDNTSISDSNVVTILKGVREATGWDFSEDNTLVFIASKDMLEGDRRSVYMITEEMFFEILETGISTSERDDISKLRDKPE
jgi:hypothetical protein